MAGKEDAESESGGFGAAGFGSATFSVSAPPVFGGEGGGQQQQQESEAGEDGAGGAADPEAECKAEFTPVVQLDDVETSTGEESEHSLFESKAKLYRYLPDKEEWKERGTGSVRLLQADDSKIRCLMRRNKTLKICCNFYLLPGISLTPKPGSDTTLMWSCLDFADETEKMEMFAMRFPDSDTKDSFRSAFNDGLSTMERMLGASGGGGESHSASQNDATSKLKQKHDVDEITKAVEATSVESSTNEAQSEQQQQAHRSEGGESRQEDE
jgi:Ran-binding protein 1